MSLKVLATVLAYALLVGACAPAKTSPVVYADNLQAFRDVCIAPDSHGAIVRAAQASGWKPVKGDAIPAMLVGNGMVDLAEVRQGEIGGQPVLISVGDLSGTSFCRIYFHPAAPQAVVERLKAVAVLGAPLGQPDDAVTMNFPEGWVATGWHLSRQSQWRSVYYGYDPDGQGPNAAWQSIEITRPI